MEVLVINGHDFNSRLRVGGNLDREAVLEAIKNFNSRLRVGGNCKIQQKLQRILQQYGK